jgi:LacI family transcriptional regulator
LANIKDVAREAGVSVATVSRVFNDSGLVSEETRALVRAVAERLNYWPNGVARSLITNRTHAVGVLLPDLHGEFFSEVIRGIDLAARREGLHLLVSSSHADRGELLAAIRSMRGRIDGLIVMAPDVDARDALHAGSAHFPLVLLDPGGAPQTCDTISIANYEGAHEVTRHLLGLGHRRIAAVTGPPGNIDARQRLEGYREALRTAGAESGPELEIPGDFSERSGYEAAARLLALAPRPDAVFAGNDSMAVGLMSALNDRGVRVPDDLAIAGFDDIALARYVSPPLTTVHVDAFRLGERSVQMLVGLLGRPAGAAATEREPAHEVLEARLVVRGSCGAVSRGGADPRDARRLET